MEFKTRPLSGITSAVKILLLANIVLFALSFTSHRDFTAVLGMHSLFSPDFRWWQYVTYMFMHANFEHIFFNMFALWMFGRVLENVWGTKRFLIFYFVCGIGAAVVNNAIGWWQSNQMMQQYLAFIAEPDPGMLADFARSYITPSETFFAFIDAWMRQPDNLYYVEQGKEAMASIIRIVENVPMVGASGAIFGILLAFGMLFPNTEMYFIFVPIPIKAKYMVFGYGLLELVLGVSNNVGDNVAHFAHLGGMVFGFIMLMLWRKNRQTFY